jgi:hypothetical protein
VSNGTVAVLALGGLAAWLWLDRRNKGGAGPATPIDDDVPVADPAGGVMPVMFWPESIEGALWGGTFSGGRLVGHVQNDAVSDWAGTVSFRARPVSGVYGGDPLVTGETSLRVPARSMVPVELDIRGRMGYSPFGSTIDVETFVNGRPSVNLLLQ